MRRPWHRFRLDGDRVNLMGEPQQNESIDQLTNALDVELWDQPTIATGMAVDLYLCDSDAETIVAQFAGVINHIVAQSSPHHVVLTCTGPLAKTRRVRDVTVDLSGMTDGEAIELVLTYCDIDFDSADIQDAGYVLGAETPIVWTRDTPGSEVIRLLNDPFGMALIETGAGRVCRFAYDLAPNAATISRTFHRATDTLYFVGERGRGDLDAIQNVWQIQGASWTDAEGCQETVWGRSAATHAKLGVGVNVRSRSFSSEIIQDESLAEAVARRMARWYNREPDEIRIETANDPQLVCGLVIGVDDAVYGMDLASVKRYTIVGIDRTGPRMTIRGIGGDAGEAGTVTTGVEQLCNQLPDDLNLPGDFELPEISFPPFPDLGDLDLDLDFPPLVGDLPDLGGLIPFPDLSGIGTDPMVPEEPGSSGTCFAPTGADWNPGVFDVTFGTGNVQFNDGSENGEIVLIDPATVAADQQVTWNVHVEFGGPGNGTTDVPLASFIMTEAGTPNGFAGVQVEWNSVTNDGFIYLYGYDAGFDQQNVTDAEIYNGFDLSVIWSPTTNSVSYVLTTAADDIYSASVDLDVEPGDQQVTMNWTSASALTMTTTNNSMCIGEETDLLGVNIGDWVEVDPTLSGIASLVLDQQGSAYNPTVLIDPSISWTMTATITMGADGSSHEMQIGVGNSNAVMRYGIVIEDDEYGQLGFLNTFHDVTDFSGTAFADGTELQVVIAWNALTTTITGHISDGLRTEFASLFDDGSLPVFNLYPVISSSGAPGGTGGMEVTAFTLTVDS